MVGILISDSVVKYTSRSLFELPEKVSATEKLASFEKTYWRIEPLSAEHWLTVITYWGSIHVWRYNSWGRGVGLTIRGGSARKGNLAVTMYKIHNELSPLNPRRIFTNTSNVPTHTIIRNSELNYVPRLRAESEKGSLHYRESVLWNKISSEIRNLPSLNVFKTSWERLFNTPWIIVTLIIINSQVVP